jgi:hypothetical protein
MGFSGSHATLVSLRLVLGPRQDRDARPLRHADMAPACVYGTGDTVASDFAVLSKKSCSSR